MNITLLCSWMSLLVWAGNAQFKTPLTFEVPADVEVYSIRDIDFGPNGNLYALNASECLVYVWDDQGKFLFQFGQRGFGPGEMDRCGRIFVGPDTINVFSYQRRIYRFDLQGHFLKSLDVTSAPFDIQSFGFTQQDRLVMGGRSYLPETRSSVIRFALFADNGSFQKTLHEYADAGVLQINGEIGFNAEIIAYAPQTDIQVNKQGQLLLGYGSQPYLLTVKANGELGEKRTFPLVTGPPSDREKELFSTLEIALPNGQYVGLNSFPDIHVHWDKDKAYFYNFTPLDNQEVIFNLTPMGQIPFANAFGFNWGWLGLVQPNTTRSRLDHFYEFKEDSVLFLKRGRLILSRPDLDGVAPLVEVQLER